MAEPLAAGEELDRLVAERVMALIPCGAWQYVNFGTVGGPALVKRCEHARCYSTMAVGSMHGTVGGPPRYSTSWAAMGELVAHLTAQGKAVEIAPEPHQPSERRWQAVVDGYYALAATWPHAVALAALAALPTGAGGDG